MNAVTEVMDELRKALALVDQLGNARDKAECELAELQRRTSEALAQAVEWQRERDDARATWKAVCMNLNDVEAERDRLRDELAEANARRGDLRTALEWANEERDRLQRERDEARAEVERLTREPAVHPSNLTDVVSLLEDERDELLVRVANQDAELRATRETYRDAYRRGAEAMREACARWMSEREGISQWVYDDALSALPIPEEP